MSLHVRVLHEGLTPFFLGARVLNDVIFLVLSVLSVTLGLTDYNILRGDPGLKMRNLTGGNPTLS